ncbi:MULTISPECIES: hemerythrin domain-containing protein [Clostridium]|uniref:hemerythrin domain-containing protein n=1 Tax=Clostridium TaxID=1485 RepID=UPI000826AE8C|nr:MULTISPECIES: hemerythrin domain-containing protein [Clostridium]PJI07988.1 cation-binding protein [Clostridium sp. CT7]
MYIDNLKRQHTDIYENIKSLKNFINGNVSEENAAEIARDVSVLAGILKVHLQAEDKFLYPDLLNSDDKNINKVAKEYIDDMGSLGNEFEQYKNKYNTKNKVCENIVDFKNNTHRIVNLIQNRLDKEDKYLYPLIG